MYRMCSNNWKCDLVWIFLFVGFISNGRAGGGPKFGEPITNVTVPVGREAMLVCIVEDLGTYKVAWVRVDTQTILTIHNQVITRNQRIGVTHSDHRTWYLHIRGIRESDRGFYMCQINTDPMKSQVGYMEVVVPPDILDYPTSSDMMVREGANVTLVCAATGYPYPTITWRREDKIKIPLGDDTVESIEGSILNVTKVNRLNMGAYLCIASNGIPPIVSKRVMLIVQFPPMIWIPNQLVGAFEGQDVSLECHSEAYPKPINYWIKGNGEIIGTGEKFDSALEDSAYRVSMRLTIRNVSLLEFGAYICVSKNSLGETDGTIKLYRMISSTTTIISKTTIVPDYNRVTIRKGKKLKGDSAERRQTQNEVANIVPEADLLKERTRADIPRQTHGRMEPPLEHVVPLQAETSSINSGNSNFQCPPLTSCFILPIFVIYFMLKY